MESDIAHDLDRLNIRDILNADSRPTFIIDLDPDDETPLRSKAIQPVFANSALATHERLLDAVRGEQADEKTESVGYGDFKNWATGITTQDDSKDVFPLFFLYKGLLWTGSTVAKRWRLISGNRLWQHPQTPASLSSTALSRASTPNLKDQDTPKAEVSKTPKQELELKEESPAEDDTTYEMTPTEATLIASTPRKFPFRSWWRGGTSKGSSDRITGSSSSGSFILGKPEKAVADWTVANPKGLISPYIQLLRDIDWASTPLGPMDSWSPELRQVANLVVNNPHPANIFWGHDMTMLYNEAYAVRFAGNKHPSMLGTGASGPWSEAWDVLGSALAEVVRTGVSFRSDNNDVSLFRRGFLEETHVSWSLTPLYGGTDRIVGFYNAPFETTDLVLSQRRMGTINKVHESLRKATSVKSFWKSVLDGLEDNHRDVPFALLYSVGEAEEADHQSSSSGSTISSKSCFLEGTIGIPLGHEAAPEQIDLKRSYQGFVPSFREAMRMREPTLVRIRDGTLPGDLLHGIQWRGFGEPGTEAIIFPVRPTNGETVLAFLVLGVNPRRPYDEGYISFATLLNNQLATSLASIILFEDETRRSRDAAEAAALDNEELTQQLNLQASRLRRMTELSPLGMFLTSPEGILREANDRFYEMTGHSRDGGDMSWTDLIKNSERTMEEGWHRLSQDMLPWSGEVKLENPVTIHGEAVDFWVLVTAHPEITAGGTLRSIMGSITDISHLKWAQGLQNRRLQEAEETRRQQNEFIDITSHEMRNPLSAILQCADDITSAMQACRASGKEASQDVMESCLDASQTIALCVQHQRSIVDDILTVSKLDSNLLLITPVICQPQAIVERVIKMFESEMLAKDITLEINISSEFQDLAVDWVAMDPSRVLQILINLMTNAIKFTASSPTRVIKVAVGVSKDPPELDNIPGFAFAPIRGELGSVVESDEWGSGDGLYVRYRVQDTGCGLSDDERKMLFQRFKQASPRTHYKYGGSGLGLFISKRLAELHGGRIGVASTAGKGSAFGFYVQARRSSPPDEQDLFQPVLSETSSSTTTTKKTAQLLSPNPSARTRRQSLLNAVFTPSSLTIHIVEDNLINQKVLVNQLRKAGCTVSATNDGIEALEFLKKTHFFKPDGGSELSVILMDLEMPNMDGYQCVREIRRLEMEGEIRTHVPVIAVTANVRDEQIRMALDSGMDDLVSKPFRIPEVMSKIEGLLKRYDR
ncbi:Hybrid signal transduction histidine kinase K [Fusarium beomiforme]|uniref:Hybrid signal transduction histidine kinase K n=1 Tax=Fusarium beomiforme TaxID=44412 RepID=A0A9P5DR85_9HYPO|nr:Hybrid signal transduction histidine kinase K [Fusarium beomiforme]